MHSKYASAHPVALILRHLRKSNFGSKQTCDAPAAAVFQSLEKSLICLRKGIERACSNHCNQRDRCILPQSKTLPICWRRRAGGSSPACQHDAAILGRCVFSELSPSVWKCCGGFISLESSEAEDLGVEVVQRSSELRPGSRLRLIQRWGVTNTLSLWWSKCWYNGAEDLSRLSWLHSKIRREVSNSNMRDSLLVRS